MYDAIFLFVLIVLYYAVSQTAILGRQCLVFYALHLTYKKKFILEMKRMHRSSAVYGSIA